MFHTQEATVLRDGEKHNITAEKLVVGDVIFVKFGDRVPADIRVTEARGFKVHFFVYVVFITWLHTAVCGKVVGKVQCTRQPRKALWVVFRS